MFSTRTTSQDASGGSGSSSGGASNQNSSVSVGTNDPVPSNGGDGGNTGPPEPPPDCPATYVQMQLQIVPELDLTICKPKIKLTNKAVCVPNCECEGCV